MTTPQEEIDATVRLLREANDRFEATEPDDAVLVTTAADLIEELVEQAASLQANIAELTDANAALEQSRAEVQGTLTNLQERMRRERWQR